MIACNVHWKVFLVIATLCVGGTATACCSELPPPVQSKVTKKDTQGRVQVMETSTRKGMCIAEIVYDETPRIYVVVSMRTKLKNIGFLQIIGGTKENLTDAVLMSLFGQAISEHCLPLIVEGIVVI